ncbi:MAG: ribosome small subunit-dependent GTPase A [Gemmatimonadetes bacterium]|nr:ribosome small subunit-dependent GTPase A [Gemmatimonadota bacterium]NIS34657.1 ribosome small subunit-dependent GTPase A [Actinomycetota bacterium]NIU69417.1 ribosome small subunit-dependent GTPase A [Actinomycetota bacterium]NIW31282.1 ribosome small subunit-dependent GTPase A [Actinomycetota bacterium]NIY11421.1 ribosome small subunit-dependent GTPase A [Gemmatimonadota bacterium]
MLRGRLKREQRTGDAVVVGDRVEVLRHPDDGHTIEGVAERTSELARRAPGRGRHRAKVMVANVDQIVAVFAVTHPAPRLRMLDRFLVLAEANDLDATVVANKVDLAIGDRAAFEVYEAIGYPVIYTSAATGEGIDRLRETLCDRISALAGPSGVGKSSLLNAMEPGLGLRTGEVSEAVRKGRHTTVSARLIPLECGGYVADTPGLRELGLWGIEPEELDLCFPELRPYVDDCRYGRSCSHSHEPGCAVRPAVEAGAIPTLRYEHYVSLLAGDD